jgi:hypothetical protein
MNLIYEVQTPAYPARSRSRPAVIALLPASRERETGSISTSSLLPHAASPHCCAAGRGPPRLRRRGTDTGRPAAPSSSRRRPRGRQRWGRHLFSSPRARWFRNSLVGSRIPPFHPPPPPPWCLVFSTVRGTWSDFACFAVLVNRGLIFRTTKLS